MNEGKAAMPAYHVVTNSRTFRLGLCLSRALNVIILNGSEEHTLSGHIAHLHDCFPHMRRWRWARVAIDLLFFFDPNHCEQSITRDRHR